MGHNRFYCSLSRGWTPLVPLRRVVTDARTKPTAGGPTPHSHGTPSIAERTKPPKPPKRPQRLHPHNNRDAPQKSNANPDPGELRTQKNSVKELEGGFQGNEVKSLHFKVKPGRISVKLDSMKLS